MSLARALLLSLIVLFLPGAAQAAPPWSAPAPIAGGTDAFAGLTFAPGGAGFAGWSVGGAVGGSTEVFGAAIGSDGAAGPARRVGSGMLAGSFAAFGTDQLVAVGGTYTVRPRPVYALGTIEGALGAPRRLAGTRRGYAAGLAANARGDWATVLRLCPVRGRSCTRTTPYLVVRRAGAKPAKPIRLGERGPVYSATVAVNARGDVLAVWERPLRGSSGRRGVYARVRTAAGRLLRTKRLGSSEPFPKLSAALGDDRRVLVGWTGQRVNEGTPHSPAETFVSLDGSAQRVDTVPNLGTGHYVGQAGVRVAIAADGRALAAWTGFEGDRFVVKAAEVRSGAPVQVVSDPAVDTVLGDLATGGGGEAVVVGLTGLRGNDPGGNPFAVGVVAAARGAGATTFGALETIAEPKDFREAVDVEFVPGTSRVVVVWRDLGARSSVTAARG